MRFILTTSAALLAALLAGGAARADLAFQFTDTSGAALTNVNLSQGQTATIDVYLVESNGGTTLNSAGLQSAGVQLNYTAAVAGVANTAAIAPNPAFDFSNTPTVGANFASLDETATTPVTSSTGRILVGAFTFTANGGGSTEVLTADPHPGQDDTVDGNGNVLDDQIANAGLVITVAAVPEPGPLVLTGVVAPLLGLGAWLARRKWTAAAA